MGALQNNTVRESYFVFCLWKALSLSVKNIQQLDERRSLMTFYNYKAQLLDEFSTSKMFLFEYDSLLHKTGFRFECDFSLQCKLHEIVFLN